LRFYRQERNTNQEDNRCETPLCVVIIEDLRQVREGLSMQVSGTNGLASVGSYPTMEELL